MVEVLSDTRHSAGKVKDFNIFCNIGGKWKKILKLINGDVGTCYMFMVLESVYLISNF